MREPMTHFDHDLTMGKAWVPALLTERAHNHEFFKEGISWNEGTPINILSTIQQSFGVFSPRCS